LISWGILLPQVEQPLDTDPATCPIKITTKQVSNKQK